MQEASSTESLFPYSGVDYFSLQQILLTSLFQGKLKRKIRRMPGFEVYEDSSALAGGSSNRLCLLEVWKRNSSLGGEWGTQIPCAEL